MRAHGLHVLRLAIPDTGVPRAIADVDRLLDELDSHERSGGRIVIHCRGGLGRTGTIAGCYLVRQGRAPADALAMLARIRGNRPENDAQRSFIERNAHHTAATLLSPIDPAATAPAGPAGARALLAPVESEVRRFPARAASLLPNRRSHPHRRRPHLFRRPLHHFHDRRVPLTRRRPPRRRHRPRRARRAPERRPPHPPQLDIGTLQATAPPGTLFQVASQFNCLESRLLRPPLIE